MKFWAKIALGAAFTGSIIGVYFIDEFYTKKEEEKKTKETKALDFDKTKLIKLAIENEKGKVTIERSTPSDDWKITEPRPVRAEQSVIADMLEFMANAKIEINVTDSDKILKQGGEALAKYGLDKPKIHVVLTSEDKSVREIYVGNEFNIGVTNGENFTPNYVYARRPDKSDLLVLSTNVLNSAFKKGFPDLRTKKIGDYKAEDVKSYVVTRSTSNEKIILVKNDKDWKITSPREMDADPVGGNLLVDKYSNQLVLDIAAEKERVNENLLNQFNLINPYGVVEFFDKDSKILQKISIGVARDSVYLTMADGAIGRLELKNLPDLLPELKAFRDKRVIKNFDFKQVNRIKTQSDKVFLREGVNWYAQEEVNSNKSPSPIVTPKIIATLTNPSSITPTPLATPTKNDVKDAAELYSLWELMLAEDVIDNVKTSEYSKYGFDKPLTKFSFEFTDPEKGKEEILVGNRVPKNEKMVYVKRVKGSEVYIVKTDWLENLGKLDSSKKD